MNSRPSKPVLKNKTDVLTFGKYKGMTVRYILDVDPSYILWLDEEKICSISQSILDNATDEDLNQQLDEMDFGLPDPWDMWGDDD